MKTFSQLCKAVADSYQQWSHFHYNWGANYISMTFNHYEDMHLFMKSSLYKELRQYRILTRYTKFLYFEDK